MLLQSFCSCSLEEGIVHAGHGRSAFELITDPLCDCLPDVSYLIGVFSDVLHTWMLEDFTKDLDHRLIYRMIRGQLFRVSRYSPQVQLRKVNQFGRVATYERGRGVRGDGAGIARASLLLRGTDLTCGAYPWITRAPLHAELGLADLRDVIVPTSEQ